MDTYWFVAVYDGEGKLVRIGGPFREEVAYKKVEEIESKMVGLIEEGYYRQVVTPKVIGIFANSKEEALREIGEELEDRGLE